MNYDLAKERSDKKVRMFGELAEFTKILHTKTPQMFRESMDTIRKTYGL